MRASRDMAKLVSQEAYGYDMLIAYELFMRFLIFVVVKNVAAFLYEIYVSRLMC